MLHGKVPSLGFVRLKEEATITLRAADGRNVTRLLSDVSKEPFEHGSIVNRAKEWRLYDGRVVRQEGRLVSVFPMIPDGGISFV